MGTGSIEISLAGLIPSQIIAEQNVEVGTEHIKALFHHSCIDPMLFARMNADRRIFGVGLTGATSREIATGLFHYTWFQSSIANGGHVTITDV